MSDLSVSILFRAINAVTAPARAVSEAVSGVTAATRAATSASQLATQATRNEATGSIAAAKAIREQVTATTAAATGNNALAAAANNSATAFARQATEATRAATAAASLAKVPPPPSIGAPGAPIIPGAPRTSNPRAELDSALMAGMTGTIVGTHLSGIGGMLARPVTNAVGVAAQFEATMSGVGAVANTTESELRSLNKQARDLGVSTTFSATQAAEGMRFLGMAGFRANQIMAAMPATLDMARAGAIDLGRAADISSNILTGFGLEADKMPRVADVLTQTFTTSNTDLLMLGESMKYIAPIARGLGITIEETAAMVGHLGNAGIQGSQAGTTLRAALLRLAAPRNASEKMLASIGLSADQLAAGANEAASALASLGIESKDSEGNLRPIAKLLRDIAAATEEYGQAERAAILSRIFGVEAASGMIELINQAGSGALDAYITRIMENSEGAASRVAKKMGDNFAGAVIEMRSAWEGFQISIGKPVGNFLTPFVNVFTTGLRVITKLAEAVPPLAGAFGLLVGGLGVTLLVASSVATTIAAFVGGVAAAKYGIIVLIPWLKTLKFQLYLTKIHSVASAFGIRLLGLRSLFTAAGLRALSLSAIACGRSLILLSLSGLRWSVIWLARFFVGIIALTPVIARLSLQVSILAVRGFVSLASMAIPLVIAAIGKLTAIAIPALIAAIQWLNISIYSIPIIGWILAIVGALIAVGVLIYKYWQPIKRYFFDFFGSVKQGTTGMLSGIGASLKTLAEWLQLDHAWEGFTGLIKAAGQTFDQLIVKPFKYVMSVFTALASFFGIGSPAIAAPDVSAIDVTPPAITAPAVIPASSDPKSVFYKATAIDPNTLRSPDPLSSAYDPSLAATGSSRNRPAVTNAPTPATRAGDTITITINAAPGQDPKAIAAEVARILESRQRHQHRNQLTDYDDNA